MNTLIEFTSERIVQAGGLARSEAARVRDVTICDTQPLLVEGIRSMLAGTEDLRFARSEACLPRLDALARVDAPGILVLDKAFGIHNVLNWLAEWRGSVEYTPKIGIIVWGGEMSQSEALHLILSGVRGIIQKSADIRSILSCFRSVGDGHSWTEDRTFRGQEHRDRYSQTVLTNREQQVLELVQRGFKNKEIAVELGIQTGTVKIHLKHVFAKTGVRGRYGLALRSLRHSESPLTMQCDISREA